MATQRRDDDQRPTEDWGWLGFRWRHLDLVHAGETFLRRRGIEHERGGGLLVHRIDGPDPGMDLHDHPWAFTTLVLRGGYTEEAAPTSAATAMAADAEWNDELGGNIGACTRGGERDWPRWSIHRMPRTARAVDGQN